jgi:hypothetical protein
MRPQAFESYCRRGHCQLRQRQRPGGRWPSSTALARARAEFDRLLRKAWETPNHFIYEIEDEATRHRSGSCGSAVVEASDTATATSTTSASSRSSAAAAMHALRSDLIEAVAADKGLPSIALHVFSFNTARKPCTARSATASPA